MSLRGPYLTRAGPHVSIHGIRRLKTLLSVNTKMLRLTFGPLMGSSGTSFDEHVMGAYTFLMRFYSPGDDIFFFGFSRGSYTARFLAEMLDYVGLLSAGNEELIRFAWKTFAQWQQRHGQGPEEEKKKKEMFEFMRGFRETFSCPVRRIRFLGLFDTGVAPASIQSLLR